MLSIKGRQEEAGKVSSDQIMETLHDIGSLWFYYIVFQRGKVMCFALCNRKITKASVNVNMDQRSEVMGVERPIKLQGEKKRRKINSTVASNREKGPS